MGGTLQRRLKRISYIGAKPYKNKGTQTENPQHSVGGFVNAYRLNGLRGLFTVAVAHVATGFNGEASDGDATWL